MSRSSVSRRARALATNLGVLGISFGLGVGLCELAVRAFVPVREVGEKFSEYHPLYGKVLKKNNRATRTTPEFTFTMTTNSLGFRGPEPKQPIHDAIIFLGDSYTMGYGVDDGQEYPALLARHLEDTLGPAALPVINAGIGNVGNGRWVRFLRDEAPKLDPELIVLQFCSNDFADNRVEGLYGDDAGGGLVELPTPLPSPRFAALQGAIESIPGITSSYAFALLLQAAAAPVRTPFLAQAPNVDRKAVSPDDPELLRVSRLTYQIVDKALRVAEEHRWPVIFLLATIELMPGQEERLVALAKAHGAEVIEVPQRDERPDLYYRVDAHWNAAGHRWVAEALANDPVFIAATRPERISRSP